MSKISSILKNMYDAVVGKTDAELSADPEFAKKVGEFAEHLKADPTADLTPAKPKLSKTVKFSADKKLAENKKTVKIKLFEETQTPMEAIGIMDQNGDIETVLVDGIEMQPKEFEPAAEPEPETMETDATTTEPETMETTYPIDEKLTLVVGEIGQPVFVRDEAGGQIAVTAGTHTALDGTEIVVDENGMLLTLVKPDEALMSEMPAVFSAKKRVTKMLFHQAFASPDVAKTKVGKQNAPPEKKSQAPANANSKEYAVLLQKFAEMEKQVEELKMRNAQPKGKQPVGNETLEHFKMQFPTQDYITSKLNGGLK